MSTSMSGSLLTRFGLAWWRVCFEPHQSRLMPTMPLPRIRPRVSLARPEVRIVRCAASWERNATCVNRMPKTPATMSWNQLSPSRMKAVIAAPKPSAMAAPTMM